MGVTGRKMKERWCAVLCQCVSMCGPFWCVCGFGRVWACICAGVVYLCIEEWRIYRQTKNNEPERQSNTSREKGVEVGVENNKIIQPRSASSYYLCLKQCS